jgi:hypothetical protein
MESSPRPKRKTKKKSKANSGNCSEPKSHEHCAASSLRELLYTKIKGMQKDRMKGNSKTQETFNPEF